jgi:hypothetical protein
MKKCIVAAALLSVVTVAYLIFFPFEDWSGDAIKKSMRRGDEIAIYLEEYKEQFGHYPALLSALDQEAFNTIQPPVAGNKNWIYAGEPNANSYGLRVGTKNLERGHILMRDHRYWIHDTQ